MSALFGQASASGDISKDVALNTPPEDGISDLKFSPQSEHLAVASWDKKVRIYEINAQGGSEGKALFEHEQPVLSCCWSKVCDHVETKVRGNLLIVHRMVPKSWAQVQTGQPV